MVGLSLQRLFHQIQVGADAGVAPDFLKAVVLIKFNGARIRLRHVQPDSAARARFKVPERVAEELHAPAQSAKLRQQIQKADPAVPVLLPVRGVQLDHARDTVAAEDLHECIRRFGVPVRAAQVERRHEAVRAAVRGLPRVGVAVHIKLVVLRKVQRRKAQVIAVDMFAEYHKLLSSYFSPVSIAQMFYFDNPAV